MATESENRRLIRALAVQALYQIIDPHATKVVDEAVENALESGNYPEEEIELKDPQALKDLVANVVAKSVDIDNIISEYLGEDWSVRRLIHIDHAILQLAVYEIIYVDDKEVPPLVAVDEAIELAKMFSDDKSRKFINGVLANIVKDRK